MGWSVLPDNPRAARLDPRGHQAVLVVADPELALGLYPQHHRVWLPRRAQV